MSKTEQQIEWTHIEDVSESYTGEAHHIELSEPVKVGPIFGEETKAETAHFVVSATTSLGQPETYAFIADEEGEVQSWGELCSNGDLLVSQKGTLDWEAVADELAEAASGSGLIA